MSAFPSLSSSVSSGFELLSTQLLAAPAASISFTGIAASNTMLRLSMWLTFAGGSGQFWVRLNNDSGANYDHQYIRALTATISGARQTGDTAWEFDTSSAEEGIIAMLIAKQATGEEAQATMISGTRNDSFAQQGTGWGGEWNNTADLISRVDVLPNSGNLESGSKVILEGADPS